MDQFLDNHVVLDLVASKAKRLGDDRIISVCSGALILAAAGILDGLPATTHWSREKQTRQYSDVVCWDLDQISVHSGSIFTSAGATTGIDLALAITRMDCGNAAALEVAQGLVIQLTRELVIQLTSDTTNSGASDTTKKNRWSEPICNASGWTIY